jgi:hypothetical protein
LLEFGVVAATVSHWLGEPKSRREDLERLQATFPSRCGSIEIVFKFTAILLD